MVAVLRFTIEACRMEIIIVENIFIFTLIIFNSYLSCYASLTMSVAASFCSIVVRQAKKVTRKSTVQKFSLSWKSDLLHMHSLRDCSVKECMG